jgi:predicted small secreted protein
MVGLRGVRGRLGAALLSAPVLAGILMMLSACNTAAGVGQDISATGNAVTGTADKTKQALPPGPAPNPPPPRPPGY